MITTFLLSLFNTLIVSGIGVLPESPDWLEGLGLSVADPFQGVIDSVATWGFIVPFETIGAVFPVALGGWLLAIGVRLVRIVLSYLTLGGGM